jgi:hypothetical protein
MLRAARSSPKYSRTSWLSGRRSKLPQRRSSMRLGPCICDGSVMKEGAGVGLVFISPLGVRMEYMVRLHLLASNNIAKYEALINGLRIAV